MRIVRIYHKHVSKCFVAVSLRREILTTAGSTKAVQSSPSSKRAKTNEIAAEPRRMRTSWSLNCSRTSFQRGVASSSSRAKRIVSRKSSFHDRSSFSNRTGLVRRSEQKNGLPFEPCFSRKRKTCSCVKPASSETPKSRSSSAGERVKE